MNKKMHNTTVYTKDSLIIIEGCYVEDNEDVRYEIVTITPEQVDLLIEWLKEAKAELASPSS